MLAGRDMSWPAARHRQCRGAAAMISLSDDELAIVMDASAP